MAADVVIVPPTANPCCAELRKKYARLEEKRNALRQAVKLLECQTNKLEEEKNVLRKVYEEANARADLANQANKESVETKLDLEKELQQLKSEIASLQKKGNADNRGRTQLLLTQVSEGKAEIKRLKEVLKDSSKGDVEKKLEEEKGKSAEAWRLLRVEKKNAEDEKRSAERERKQAEAFKSEAIEMRKKLELEKKKVNKEKKRGKVERAKCEEQMRLLELERNKLAEEKAISRNLSEQLQDKMREVEILRQEGLGSSRVKKVRNEDNETANFKLWREKEKFHKQQLKHAKKVAKLHKAEKIVLLQQLYLLKQDHVQFSNRLEMLISCFPYVIDGTNGSAKVGENLNKHGMKSQRAFSCGVLNSIHSQIDPEKAENVCSPKECDYTSVPQGRGHIKSVSGTCSGSVRDKSQNSVICSTDVTFSATRMGGPQGKAALNGATSSQLDLRFPGDLHVSINEFATGAKRRAEDILEPGLQLKAKRKKPRKGERNSSPKSNMPSSYEGCDFDLCEGDASDTKKQDDRYGCEGAEISQISDGIQLNIHEPSLFGGMDPDGYLKLLDLDDEVEEKRYQEAKSMLLSPNLPEIRSPILDDSSDTSIHKLELSFQDQLGCDLFPAQETSENSSRVLNMDSELISQSTEMELLTVPSRLPKATTDHFQTACQNDAGKFCDPVFSKNASLLGFLDTSVTSSEGTKIDSYSKNPTAITVDSMTRVLDERIRPAYDCVIVSSNIKDERAFCRILQVMDAIIHEKSWGKDEGFMLTEGLHALSHKVDISSKEKASAICSLLLHKISAKISTPKDLTSVSSSFQSEANKVISLFCKIFPPDIFIRILQDFIISKMIMVPREGDHAPENSDVSKQYIYQNRPWFQTTGQLSQLIAGSMILASVSLVLDRIDILWQTLYHLLESCTDDFHWILRTFDVFALVSGSKLFSSDNCDLIPLIIKLVVSHLKREMESDKEKACWFSPVRVWFMEDELSPDKVGKLLMEELHSLLDDSMKSAVTTSSARARNSKEFCEGDCPLQNLARQLEYNVDIRVCSFIDVVSLVELTGRYMGWEWLWRIIFPELFSILESCSCSQFSVPILVLICQLIRIGVKSKGILEESESVLISCLSGFLERERKGGTGDNLPMQFAAVEGLLNFLPLDFREIISDQFDAAQLTRNRAACAELIRGWFFCEIGKEQAATAIGYFGEVEG